MPISPEMGADLAAEVADIYADAELRILRQVVWRLTRGMALEDWQMTRLANLRVLREEVMTILADLDARQASLVAEKIAEAYGAGEAAALGDVGRFVDRTSAVLSPARRTAVELIAQETSGAIRSAHIPILRQTVDAYQQVVGRVVADTLTSSVSREAATQNALRDLLGRGIRVGPSGRNYNLPDYVKMAVRTGTAKASVEGHLDTLEELGLNLVMINPGPRHCEICDKWSNQVLWRRSGPTGVQTVDSLTSVTRMQIDVIGSLDAARAAGWGHPNCRCSVRAYLPGATTVSPRPSWDEDGYQAQQRQRAIEKQIREWKTREAIAITPEESAKAKAKVAAWQKAQRDHIKDHSYLKRQSRNEQVG